MKDNHEYCAERRDKFVKKFDDDGIDGFDIFFALTDVLWNNTRKQPMAEIYFEALAQSARRNLYIMRAAQLRGRGRSHRRHGRATAIL